MSTLMSSPGWPYTVSRTLPLKHNFTYCVNCLGNCAIVWWCFLTYHKSLGQWDLAIYKIWTCVCLWYFCLYSIFNPCNGQRQRYLLYGSFGRESSLGFLELLTKVNTEAADSHKSVCDVVVVNIWTLPLLFLPGESTPLLPPPIQRTVHETHTITGRNPLTRRLFWIVNDEG